MRKFHFLVSLVILLSCGFISLAFFQAPATQAFEWSKETPLSFVLKDLGEAPVKHALPNWSPDMVKRGEQLVMQGSATGPNGETGTRISQYFTCNSCHNTVQENPDLSNISPASRLKYAADNNVGFYQATTFYGIANRETWFNDDYVERYGDRAKAAQGDLREAIQLCSEECSQGRALEAWEEETILAYFWSLEIRLGDLGLTDGEIEALKLVPEKEKKRKKHVTAFKLHYPLTSPATFGKVPTDPTAGYGLTGIPENGKLIFDFACQKCHMYGVANINFYDSNDTFQKMKENTKADNSSSVYRILREGTEPSPEHPLYMPRYTEERMSDQQIEDLKAYVVKRAGDDY